MRRNWRRVLRVVLWIGLAAAAGGIACRGGGGSGPAPGTGPGFWDSATWDSSVWQ